MVEEAEEDEEEDEEEEEEAKESTKSKILRLVAEVASKVKEIIGNLITTAGQVVVTILLGLTGGKMFKIFSESQSEIFII